MTDVVLVCMPFGPAFAPSLGLSLLKGEVVFPELVKRVCSGMRLDAVQGVITRESVEAGSVTMPPANAPAIGRMDDLPYPDYADYMRQFKASCLDRDWMPALHVETSRGCWWGERQHCTFCGLNGATMA